MKSYPKLLASVFFIFTIISNIAFAEGKDKQAWSIKFQDDIAVIRATSGTATKYIQATIEALKSENVEKFSLKATEENVPLVQKNLDVVIEIQDNDAELVLSPDLQHKYVVALIKHLNEAGINEIKLTIPTE